MSKLNAIGLCVGILAGLWFWVSSLVPLLVTVCGFFAYSSFYAAGGGKKGIVVSLAANLSGIVWAVVSVVLGGVLNNLFGTPMLGVVLATMLCSGCVVWQAHIKFLGFVPGAFLGMTSYFASGNDWLGTAVSMILGVLIGFLSEAGGNLLSDLTTKKGEAG